MPTAQTSKAVIQLGGYRSKGDIARDILEILSEGPQTKTTVMYKAFMSFAQTKQYQTWLEDAGLIAIDADGRWSLTDKGARYAKALQKAEDILKEAQA